MYQRSFISPLKWQHVVIENEKKLSKNACLKLLFHVDIYVPQCFVPICRRVIVEFCWNELHDTAADHLTNEG